MLIWGFDYKQNNPVFLRENGWRLTTPLLIIYPHNQVLHHGVNLKLTYRYYRYDLPLLLTTLMTTIFLVTELILSHIFSK